ncbi:MAG TPA: sigma-70 family RNA polymerase sigma factor [Polyangia bacterium]|nr:sigma-70 family RNA polymerase sigma factor [Polyangia bacterium]
MELHEFIAELYPHARLLSRLARRWAGADADDLVQETFARAIAARHRYQPGSNGRAWLCRILCNLAISERRRRMRDERLRARVMTLVPAEPPREPEPPPLDEGDLAAALAALAPAERRILELAEIEELSYREIARALDCPVGTVMSRLHRARRHLRQAAQARLPEQTATLRAAA